MISYLTLCIACSNVVDLDRCGGCLIKKDLRGHMRHYSWGMSFDLYGMGWDVTIISLFLFLLLFMVCRYYRDGDGIFVRYVRRDVTCYE